MRGGDQFLGIRTFALFEASAKRILCVGKYTAIGRDCSLAIFQATVPNG
jgi:hypothetical protein